MLTRVETFVGIDGDRGKVPKYDRRRVLKMPNDLGDPIPVPELSKTKTMEKVQPR